MVRKACDTVPNVSLLFGAMQALCTFFRASPKRACLLDGVLPGSCATRWLTRGKCVDKIENKFKEIKTVLENVSRDSTYTSSTKAEAFGLHSMLLNIDNVFLLKVFKRIFCMSDAVTKGLQQKN